MQFESNIKRENFETIADFVDNLITEVPRIFSDKQKTKIGQIFKRYCL